MIDKIAVLITCHNRKNITLDCLASLYQVILPSKYTFEVYLVDDGSTDGTGEAVKENFPQVDVIQGDGNLFWNRGMRLAWETAKKQTDYDYYLWLNDDTILDSVSLNELLQADSEARQGSSKPAIICGACRDSLKSDNFSYGGRSDFQQVIPNGKLQPCKYINGNVVLVPKKIFHSIGNLSGEYTHSFGDFDYGLRTIIAGFNCYTTKIYIATCAINEGMAVWCNPKISLRKRWQLFHSPKGLNIKEYNIFRRKFWGRKWIIYALKAYLKVLIPSIYHKISNSFF